MLYVGYSSLADLFRGYSRSDVLFISDAVSREKAMTMDEVQSAEVYVLVVRVQEAFIVHYAYIVCGRYPVTIHGPISERERSRITADAGKIRDRLQDWIDASEINRYTRGLFHLPLDLQVLRTTEHCMQGAYTFSSGKEEDPLSHD